MLWVYSYYKVDPHTEKVNVFHTHNRQTSKDNVYKTQLKVIENEN